MMWFLYGIDKGQVWLGFETEMGEIQFRVLGDLGRGWAWDVFVSIWLLSNEFEGATH